LHPTAFQSRYRLGILAVIVSATAVAAEPHKARLSSEQSTAIRSSLPRFVPSKPVAPPSRTAIFNRPESLDADVLSLPTMVVEEKKIKKQEFQTMEGKVAEYMDTYLGGKTGLDRGFLNKKTLNKKVGPASVALMGATTNADRALEARFDDQRLQHRDELLHTAGALILADPEKAAWLRREAAGLYYRKPDLTRK
jgi:hypothetical protein